MKIINKRNWLLLVVISTVSFIIWVYLPFKSNDSDIKDNLVAHGCGTIDGFKKTNSKEALMRSLEKGYKNIEIDLYLTEDNHLVCLHDLNTFNLICRKGKKQALKYSDFKISKIYGKYTPLSFQDVINIYNLYDFDIFTDKISDVELLNRYIPDTLRERIHVEAFSFPEYKKLKENGYKPMYSATFRHTDIYRYVFDCISNRNLIDFVVVSHKSFDFYLRLLRKLGVKVAIYTRNDIDYIKSHMFEEADYIYSDSMPLGLN